MHGQRVARCRHRFSFSLPFAWARLLCPRLQQPQVSGQKIRSAPNYPRLAVKPPSLALLLQQRSVQPASKATGCCGALLWDERFGWPALALQSMRGCSALTTAWPNCSVLCPACHRKRASQLAALLCGFLQVALPHGRRVRSPALSVAAGLATRSLLPRRCSIRDVLRVATPSLQHEHTAACPCSSECAGRRRVDWHSLVAASAQSPAQSSPVVVRPHSDSTALASTSWI
jgi:hypothetical protein